VAAFAASSLYAAGGGPLLARLDGSVGEVLMHRGLRFERAGQYEAASAEYERALAARFQGPQNRVHTLKSLGYCYMKLDRPAEAAPLFAEAHASPYWARVWYGYYIQVVSGAERLAVAESWLGTALAAEDPLLAAAACYALGRAHEALGDGTAAEAAFAEGAALAPGSENDCALAPYLAARDRDHEARERALACLAKGATGEAARQARDVLR